MQRGPQRHAAALRADLDRGTAIHIARHTQRACRTLASMIEEHRAKLAENDRAATL